MAQPSLANGEDAKPVPAIIAFSNPEEFRVRHEAAIEAEFKIQEQRVERFNKMQPAFEAWVITAPPAHQPGMGYILRIDFHIESMGKNIDPPGIGQSCELRFLGYKNTPSSWCFCQSGAEIITMNDTWNDTIEVVAYPTDEDVKVLGDCLTPLVGGGIPTTRPRQSEAKSIKVHLQLEASKTTMLAELGALDRLIKGKASQAGSNAFNYLMSFSNPRAIFDLSTRFPHLADLGRVPNARLREALQEIVANFDEDQERAFSGINSLPDGICFVPGGPGSGKTWWALTVALLTQSGVGPCRILYMVDINKPVDDAVDRFYAMCRKLGIAKSVIRVGPWPLEEEEEEVDDNNGLPRALRSADFTKGFLRAMSPLFPRVVNKAPTLDQKAWECFSAQPETYPAVATALSMLRRIESGDRDLEADLISLRKSLIPLYSHVLLEADFVATTPVTATRLQSACNPDIVIFDECAHARECSTLISLAHFDPVAWFFVGDHRQTEPFVEKSTTEFASQLRISTMERADKNGAVSFQLLVNHRAHGGLEGLASGMFYDGDMRSPRTGDELYPPSVEHLRHWLSTMAVDGMPAKVTGDLRTPRLIISHNSARPSQAGTSCWNWAHQVLVMEQVEVLLHDPDFLQIGSDEPGTIMILSPYKSATQHYQGQVNRFPTQEMKRRVQVRTVDTAQGQEADVVFLDMVRKYGTAHMDDAKRLCVALTRARQAEVILMPSSAVRERKNGEDGRILKNLAAIWEKCESGEEGAVMFVRRKRTGGRVVER